MKVTSDRVKELQSRIDVTYEEAERVLLTTSGNIDRAVYLLEKRRESKTSRFMEEAHRIYKEALTYYFKIVRKGQVVVNVPLLIVVGLFLIMTVDSKIWVAVVTIGIILISESTVTIYKVENEDGFIVKNKPAEGETELKRRPPESEGTSAETNAKTDVPPKKKEIPLEKTQQLAEDEKDDDDDFYEITIEK